MASTLSAVIIARDEAEMLPRCLERLGFTDEIVVVVDSRTTDGTAEIARRYGAVTSIEEFSGFADLKNTALSLATGDWLLIVDADERVSRALAEEVRSCIRDDSADAYRVYRWNYTMGQRIQHGGFVTHAGIRLARRGVGHFPQKRVHEGFAAEPWARMGMLKEPLHHFTGRSILESVRKTAAYAELQARDRYESGHPSVTTWLLLRKVGAEIVWRLVRRAGWKDGFVGVVQCLEAALSTLVSYARLWELQQKPTIEDRYARLEDTTR
jgi:(heptosyl)LPS beta-1,4-glucosyltransferase